MTLDDFWTLIHRSSAETASKHQRTEWLITYLAQRPLPEIIEFELHLTGQRKRVDTRLVWGAAWHIMQGWCSDDGFWYFQSWLFGLGHDTFEQVAADPESLAETPQICLLAGRPRSDWSNDEWPEWELLNYVALEAYERGTGQEDSLDGALEARGIHRICNAYPEDERWHFDDTDQRRARLPRLADLLGDNHPQ